MACFVCIYGKEPSGHIEGNQCLHDEGHHDIPHRFKYLNAFGFILAHFGWHRLIFTLFLDLAMSDCLHSSDSRGIHNGTSLREDGGGAEFNCPSRPATNTSS